MNQEESSISVKWFIIVLFLAGFFIILEAIIELSIFVIKLVMNSLQRITNIFFKI